MTTNREASRRDWESRDTVESINCGSFQRIADACEKIAEAAQASQKIEKAQRDAENAQRTVQISQNALSRVCDINDQLRNDVRQLRKQLRAAQAPRPQKQIALTEDQRDQLAISIRDQIFMHDGNQCAVAVVTQSMNDAAICRWNYAMFAEAIRFAIDALIENQRSKP